jgi:hypothetical protein
MMPKRTRTPLGSPQRIRSHSQTSGGRVSANVRVDSSAAKQR